MEIENKKVTHRNKHYENGIKFHVTNSGEVLYFSETYNKWMPSEFTPESNLVEV